MLLLLCDGGARGAQYAIGFVRQRGDKGLLCQNGIWEIRTTAAAGLSAGAGAPGVRFGFSICAANPTPRALCYYHGPLDYAPAHSPSLFRSTSLSLVAISISARDDPIPRLGTVHESCYDS